MAPALTEAASHTGNLKLPYSPPATSQSTPTSPIIIVNGIHDKVHHISQTKHFNEDFLQNLPPDIVRQIGKTQFHSINSIKDSTAFIFGIVLNSAEQTGEFQDFVSLHTMNSETIDKSDSQNMGLVKANSVGNSDISKPVNAEIIATNLGTEYELYNKCIDMGELEPACVQDRAKETQARQIKLERRTERLLYRLNRLSAHYVQRHVQRQMKTLVQAKQDQVENNLPPENNSKNENKQEIMRSLPTTELVDLVKKMGAHNNSMVLRPAWLTRETKTEGTSPDMLTVPQKVAEEVEDIVNNWQTSIQQMDYTLDSDATDTSSGGESCDESMGHDEDKVKITPINKRATWQWARDRSSVAAKWTWLQSQICDLEYRIRQQNDLYRQLRNRKGAVVLGGPAPYLRETVEEDSHKIRPFEQNELNGQLQLTSADLKSKSLLCKTKSSDLPYRPLRQVNGFLNSSGSGYADSASSPENSGVNSNSNVDGGDKNNSASVNTPNLLNSETCDQTNISARTRPFCGCRKRVLVQSTASVNSQYSNRKSTRMSAVACGCSYPMPPCTMCGGRYTSVHSVDQETMSVLERIALLDPSYHPILSFKQEKSLSVELEHLLRSGEFLHSAWKSKINRTSPTKAQSKAGGLVRKKQANSSLSEHLRKRSRKLKKNAAARLTAKYRRNYHSKRDKSAQDFPSSRESSSERAHSRRVASLFGFSNRRERSLSASSCYSSKPSSPVPSPYSVDSCNSQQGLMGHDGLLYRRHSQAYHDAMKRKRNENEFDINNIVIPYNLAAATRVEKLQYKEIITPKWRVNDIYTTKSEEEPVCDKVHKNNGLLQSEEPETEDLADDNYVVRHDKCEAAEKKRYMFPAQNWRTRTRSARSESRHDSSSGANTPDPLSPHPLEPQHDSPIITPPSTPSPSVTSYDEGSNPAPPPSMLHSTLVLARRRAISFARREESNLLRPPSPEMEEFLIVPGWDSRTFPLEETDYETMVAVTEVSHDDDVTEASSSSPDVSSFQPTVEDESKTLVEHMVPCSPHPSSSSSTLDDRDPNDPDWTMSNNR